MHYSFVLLKTFMKEAGVVFSSYSPSLVPLLPPSVHQERANSSVSSQCTVLFIEITCFSVRA